MPLRIVTDSTADLPDEIARELGIAVVPLTVFFGEEALLDHVEITSPEFYRRLVAMRGFTRTSQPSVGSFQRVFADLAASGATEILCITLSSKLSGTLGSAHMASAEPPPGCTVTTLDSLSISGGLGMIARVAAGVAAGGGSTEQALSAATRLIPRHRITLMLNTLEYLQKGGRIGRAQALLGGLLNIKPLITLEAGEVAPVERVRSRQRGIERLFEIVTATPELDRIIVQHTGRKEDAASLAERLRGAVPGVPVEVGWLGPVVGVYTGPNCLGAVTIQRVTETG
jgi:DegV family protein with EDD domain